MKDLYQSNFINYKRLIRYLRIKSEKEKKEKEKEKNEKVSHNEADSIE